MRLWYGDDTQRQRTSQYDFHLRSPPVRLGSPRPVMRIDVVGANWIGEQAVEFFRVARHDRRSYVKSYLDEVDKEIASIAPRYPQLGTGTSQRVLDACAGDAQTLDERRRDRVIKHRLVTVPNATRNQLAARSRRHANSSGRRKNAARPDVRGDGGSPRSYMTGAPRFAD